VPLDSLLRMQVCYACHAVRQRAGDVRVNRYESVAALTGRRRASRADSNVLVTYNEWFNRLCG
jgi:hypothetical protein